METSIRYVKTGGFHEFYLYKLPIEYGYKIPPADTPEHEILDIEPNPISVRKSTNRAITHVRRLLLGNLYDTTERPKFITLTFKENQQDLNYANYEFQKFRQRLSYHIGEKLQYLATHELQKRGAIHYHLVTVNLPYIEHSTIQNMWGRHCSIKAINRTPNVHRYLTKYLVKSYSDMSRRYRKRYFQTLIHHPETERNQEYNLSAFTTLAETASRPHPLWQEIKDVDGNVINAVKKYEFYQSTSYR